MLNNIKYYICIVNFRRLLHIMATIRAFVRSQKSNNKFVCVRFRLSDGASVQLYHKSKIMVELDLWDNKREQYKSRVKIDEKKQTTLRTIIERKNLLLELYTGSAYKITDSKTFEKVINGYFKGEENKEKLSFFELFDLFLDKHSLSANRKNNFKVVKRSLMRYEMYHDMHYYDGFELDIDLISSDILADFNNFLHNECYFYRKYPELYAKIPEVRVAKPRGDNTVNEILGKLRTFYRWAIKHNYTNNNPFDNYKIKECVYGTPFYITIDERNTIMNVDLSGYPGLSLHRDIFVFQSLIGCRVSDLWGMTWNNIVNNAVEYIAKKTQNERPITLRVPLNNNGKEILSRYKDVAGGKLFPFPSQQVYNQKIKEFFKIAGITREVIRLNPTTKEMERKPICEIASSHLARRTFVGNLYKKLKDPNLISALSGHKEGSQAFARYRAIDDDIKKEIIEMLG